MSAKLYVLIVLFFVVNSIEAQLTAYFEFENGTQQGCPLPTHTAIISNLSSTGENVTYAWDFGKGEAVVYDTEPEQRRPFYGEAGMYTVTLTVSNGSESTSYSQNVTVFANPVASFDPGDGVCVGERFTLVAEPILGDAPIESYSWNFFGTGEFNTREVSHQYFAAGNPEVLLTVYDTNGCRNEVTENILVREAPVVQFSLENNLACQPPLEIDITNRTQSSSNLTYQWIVPSSDTTSINDRDTVFGFEPDPFSLLRTGDYWIELVAVDELGCIGRAYQSARILNVRTDFTMFHSSIHPDNEITDPIGVGYVLFRDESEGATERAWNIKNNIDSTRNPQVLFCDFQDEGATSEEYEIELVSSFGGQCPDTMVKTIVVSEEINFEIIMEQNGEPVSDVACANSLMLKNPLYRSTSLWTINGEEYDSLHVEYTTCDTGMTYIRLLSTFTEECRVSFESDIYLEKCLYLDFDLLVNGDTMTYIPGVYDTIFYNPNAYMTELRHVYKFDENRIRYLDTVIPLIPTGLHRFVPIAGLTDYTFTISGSESGNSSTHNRPLEEQMCFFRSSYEIELTGNFYDGCPQTITRTGHPWKMERPTFEVRNLTRDSIPLLYNDFFCPYDTLQFIPDSTFISWIHETDTMYIEPDSTIAYINALEFDGFAYMSGLSANGCVDTVYEFFLEDRLDLDFTVTDTLWGCPTGISFTATNESADQEWFQWAVFADSTIFNYPQETDNSNNQLLFDHQWEQEYDVDSFYFTPYQDFAEVYLGALSANGCFDYRTRILPKTEPQAYYYASETKGCAPLSVTFDGRTNEGASEMEKVYMIDYYFGLSYEELFEHYKLNTLDSVSYILSTRIHSEGPIGDSIAQLFDMGLILGWLHDAQESIFTLYASVDAGDLSEIAEGYIIRTLRYIDTYAYLKTYPQIGDVYWNYGDGSPIEHISMAEHNEIDEVLECLVSNFGNEDMFALFDTWARFAGETKRDYYQKLREAVVLMFEDSLYLDEICIPNYFDQFDPTHVYENPGTYYPSYEVYDEYGCRDTSYVLKIEVGTPLSPEFSYDKDSICYGDSIAFTNLTPNSEVIDSWHYYSDVAHLNSYCSENPDPVFAALPVETGMADLTLTMEYNGCYSSITKEDAIKVNGPIGRFRYDAECASTRGIQFEATLHDVESFVWNFEGKDTLENVENPYYEFSADGRYSVSLTMSNSSTGCDDYVYSRTISAKEIIPSIALDSVVCLSDTGRVDLSVSLNANDSGEGLYPFLLYRNDTVLQRSISGRYNVFPEDSSFGMTNLVYHVFDNNGCSRVDSIEFRTHESVAVLGMDKDRMCAPNDSLELTLLSKDSTIVSWQYQFSDSSTVSFTASDTASYMHYFSHADSTQRFTYKHRLTTQDIWGCTDTLIDSSIVYVPVGNGRLLSNPNVCYGKELEVDHQYHDADSALWIIYQIGLNEDSLYYSGYHRERKTDILMNVRGDFKVGQVAFEEGCADTTYLDDTIHVLQVDASFDLADTLICEGDFLGMTHLNKLDMVSATWEFSQEADVAYVDSNYIHKFNAPGINLVSLIVGSLSSCRDTVTDTVYVNSGQFVLQDNSVCFGEEVTFNMLYSLADSVIVDFGDGEIDTLSESTFTHLYTERDTFDVKVTSITAACPHDFSKPAAVRIENISANFEFTNDLFCKNEEWQMVLHPDSVMNALGGNWLVIDSVGNITPTPFDPLDPYTPDGWRFGNNGRYQVGLEVYSAECPPKRNIVPIKVGGPDGSIANPPFQACINQEVQFNMSNDTARVHRFEWNFGDGKIDTLNASAIHAYNSETGTISYQLTIFDNQGCFVVTPDQLYIHDVIAEFNLPKEDFCVNEMVVIENLSATVSLDSSEFRWDYGNGQTSTWMNPINPHYKEPGTYTITAHVRDTLLGCEDDASVVFNVYEYPTVSISAPDTLCDYDSVFVSAVYADTLNSYWFRDLQQVAQNTSSYADLGSYTSYYKIIVSNDYGCAVADSVEMFVIQDPSEFDRVEPADTAIYIGEVVTPRVYTPYRSIYTWSPEYEISCVNCPEPNLRPLESTEYYITIDDTEGCYMGRTYPVSITVYPEAEVKLPTVFSPNGDGENDRLFIRGWGIKEVLEFNVYNRWGQLVYASTDLKEGWDGTYNGKDQPADTYSYKLRIYSFLDDERYIDGYVDLIR